jgi:glycosyltransferase involved in cell wall biosynthesis
VRFTGAQLRPEDYLGAADAFLMTSSYEPFGQTILEALSAELPVISFRAGKGVTVATEEIVGGDAFALSCERSPEALGAKMRAAEQMPREELRRKGELSRLWIAARHSWRNLAQDCIDALLSEGAP